VTNLATKLVNYNDYFEDTTEPSPGKYIPDEYFEFKARIHDRLLDLIDLSIIDTLDRQDLIVQIRQVVENILREESLDPLLSETKVAEEAAPEETQLRMKEIEDIEKSKPTVAVDSIEIAEMSEQPQVEAEEEEEEEEEIEDETEVIQATPAAKTGVGVANEMADFVANQIKSDQPLQDINTMFTGRTRKKIIKRLFKRKENDFNNFLTQLNTISAWKDASVLIDEEFYERGINPYSKEAIIFSDIVYVRFFPKDKYVGEQD